MIAQRQSLDAIAAAYPPIARKQTERAPIGLDNFELVTADDLGLGAFDPIRAVIEHPDGYDRSADVARCARDMVRAGYADDQIIGVLMNSANAISDHILEQKDDLRAATRALQFARGQAARDDAGGLGDRGAGSEAGRAADGASRPRGGAEVQPLDLIDAGSLAGVAVGPMEFMIQNAVPARQVTLFTAPGGAGKSYMSLLMAASVSRGALAFGLKTTPAVAIYLTCEDDDDENHRRLIGVANALNTGLEGFAGQLFIRSLAGRRENGLARIDQNNKMTVLSLFLELRATIMATGARFVVLDNVAHLFEGNENIRAHVAAFVGLLNSLALETDCAILLIGHPNKSGDSYSGSTAWQNQVRSQLHLERDADDPDARTLTLAKGNYARFDEPIRVRWHRGAFRLDSDIPAGETTGASILEQAENAHFLACLAARTRQKRPVSEHVAARDSYAPKAFLGMPEAAGMTEPHFARALKRLLDTGVIERGELDFDKPGSRGHKAAGLRLRVLLEAGDEPF